MLPQAQADAPPVWSMPQFAQAVLGASLDKASAAAASASPSCTMASLLESLELCEKLLVSLHGTSTVPIIRAAATKVAAAFKKCVELCAHMQQVKDLEAFYSLLAPPPTIPKQEKSRRTLYLQLKISQGLNASTQSTRGCIQVNGQRKKKTFFYPSMPMRT